MMFSNRENKNFKQETIIYFNLFYQPLPSLFPNFKVEQNLIVNHFKTVSLHFDPEDARMGLSFSNKMRWPTKK